MKVKAGNTVGVVYHPAILYAMEVASRVWYEVTGDHMRVTGLGEEGHSQSSRHYGLVGPTWHDIRCRAFDADADDDTLTPTQRDEIDRKLRKRLAVPVEFDIVWEALGTARAHLHLEYDPKPEGSSV